MARHPTLKCFNRTRWNTTDLRALVRAAAQHLGCQLNFSVHFIPARKRGTFYVWGGRVERYHDPFAERTATLTKPGMRFNISVPNPSTFYPADPITPRVADEKLLLRLCSNLRSALLMIKGASWGALTLEQRTGYTTLPSWANPRLRYSAKRRASTPAKRR